MAHCVKVLCDDAYNSTLYLRAIVHFSSVPSVSVTEGWDINRGPQSISNPLGLWEEAIYQPAWSGFTLIKSKWCIFLLLTFEARLDSGAVYKKEYQYQ